LLLGLLPFGLEADSIAPKVYDWLRVDGRKEQEVMKAMP